MDEIIRNVLESLNSAIGRKSTCMHFPGKCVPVPFSAANFREIAPEAGEIAFVDGGSSEIISAVNFSLNFFRVYSCVYRNNKLVSSKKKEFFGLITAVINGDKVFYETKIFGNELAIPVMTHPVEGVRDGLSKTADIIRRVSEIEMAKEVDAEYVVLDGNLKADNDFVKEKLNGKKLYAVSKTNELLTDSGNSLVVELLKMSPFRQWLYFPVVELEAYEIVIAKLHPLSKYVFKIETPKNDDLKVVSALAHNSADPVFLGYPYGLVQADKFARVSNEEKEYFKVKLMTYAKNAEQITQYLNTINAHDILDSVL